MGNFAVGWSNGNENDPGAVSCSTHFWRLLSSMLIASGGFTGGLPLVRQWFWSGIMYSREKSWLAANPPACRTTAL